MIWSGFGDYTISDTGALPDTVEVDPMVTLSYVPVPGDRVIITGFMDYDYGDFQVTPISDAGVVVNLAGFDNLPMLNDWGGLVENTPNPFNPKTNINFVLTRAARIQLNVYDIRGNLVRKLRDVVLEGGPHAVEWNGRDDDDAMVASGTYFARLRIDTKYMGVQKMSLVK